MHDREAMGRGRRPAAAGAALLALALLPGTLPAQRLERHVLAGHDVAVYNLAGQLRVEAGSGSAVVVEVERGGPDARELRIEAGRIDGRQTLRVVYPDDRVVYPEMGRFSRNQIRVRGDGTFFGDGIRRGTEVTIAGSGRGLEAHADLRVLVPAGMRVAVYLGVGKAAVSNVEGELLVDIGSAPITAERTRGRLRLETGSGSVRVSDAEGEVEVDTGSGSVEVQRVRGSRLLVDTGSGSVSGSEIDVGDLNVDTGSGRIRLSAVRAPDIRLDTGSGSVSLGLLSEVRDLKIDTGSGGVTLEVPASLSAELEIDTGSGGIDVSLPMYVVERKRTYLLARLGEGNGRIEVDTGSGGVRVSGR